MNGLSPKYRLISVGLMLAAVVLACYWPVGDYGFINYDDPLYVTDNAHVQNGLTMEGLHWAFRDMKSTSNWHPLTWLSHMADWQLFRANAGGHHWTNVLFHVANTLLLFYVLHLMTGTLWRSACVAILFAVHPINVESVAWVAERKNVLSTFLGLMTLLFYAFYVRKPGLRRYLPVLTVFTLGLMAKPMLVTLPFAMLLLDFWPLGRIPIPWFSEDARRLEEGCSRVFVQPISFSGLLLEKFPLLLMASGSIALTLLAARWGGSLKTFIHFPLAVRLTNSLHAYGAYIGKFFWPSNLAVFYPLSGTPPLWQTIVSGLLIGLVTVWILKRSRSHPYLPVGWLWFLGTLVPVIGIVQVGLQAMADRYAYLPFIGLFIMLVWGVEDLSGRSRRDKRAVILFFALMILAGGLLTRHQVRFWESSRSLFTHTLSVTERNDIAHSCLAWSLFQEGDEEGAIAHYREAIRINPGYSNHYSNLGTVIARQGKVEEAMRQYQKALALNPHHTATLFYMGLAMESLGRLTEADSFYEGALREDPDYVQVYRQRGMLALKAGKYEEATDYFQAALRLCPGDSGLKELLSRAAQRSGAP